MKLEKTTKITSIIYLIVGILAVLEFFFIRGMFTGPTAMLAVAIIGIVNIVMQVLNKKYLSAAHYLLTSIALCMGYTALM